MGQFAELISVEVHLDLEKVVCYFQKKIIVQSIQFFYSGGSAYGLAVGDGIMRYLEENNIGFDTGDVKVPIVPGAVLYDLNVGNPYVRPDANMGYLACVNASDEKIHEGNYGAGTGASVGKVLGNENIMKGGIGKF